MQNYVPPKAEWWTGRCDGPSALRWHEVIKLLNLDLLQAQEGESKAEAGWALLGFCCDAGILRNGGRGGAALAPAALRRALANIPVHGMDSSLWDAGDIYCQGDDLEAAQAALAAAVKLIHHRGLRTAILGGGHEVAWGHFLGLATAYPGKEWSIINCDAHFDLRPLLPQNKGSSGTPFRQIAELCKANELSFDYTCFGIQRYGNSSALFFAAKEYDTQIVSAEEIHCEGLGRCYKLLDALFVKKTHLYLSLDLDIFAAGYAPGVSAIQPLGLTPWQLIPLLRYTAASNKLMACDIAELSPPYDRDGVTATLAAQCLLIAIGF